MFAYSYDEENYHGNFSTADEAWAALWGSTTREIGYVGECSPPTQPETYWHAEDWLENVSCQDEYCGEWCDYWDRSTSEQRAELEKEVRAVLAAWLDRHDLRPKFFNIVNPEERRRPEALTEGATDQHG